MSFRQVKTFLFFFASLLGCAGCSLFGSGENKIQRADSYDLSTPTDWKQLGSRGDSDRAYQLPSGNTVSITSHCDRNKEASLRVLTRQLLIGSRNIKTLEQHEIVIPSGMGLFTSVEAVSDGSPFFLGLAVVKKMGCVFDFSLVSPKSLKKDEVAEFIKFVKSIQYGNH